ncbi:hypothetical protein J2S70_000633 [Trueperella bonasi]|uniref:Low molecular weight protein antigen 6 PH domain-containing protein n=1 Tax=Trueperella bonasi TaxID=312286 RepID=A0ABT9NF79_9ACTO|nr:PH domain-containing protein [Trueperella bonasi]MDP9806051.1 hypothetical protein [Trueperella bonasi]
MTLVLRAKSTRFYAYLLWFLAGVILLASVMNGGFSELIWATPVSALIAAIGWATFWNPRIEVGPGGLRIVNIVREHLVPWSDLHFAENRWGLYVYSKTDAKKMSVWAVPSNAGIFSGSKRNRPEPEAIRWDDGGKFDQLADSKFVAALIETRAGQIRRDAHLRAELAEQANDWPAATMTRILPLPIALVGVLTVLTALMFTTN